MTCGHCGRVMGDHEGGFGAVGDIELCHPNVPDRPDCYRLVTVYGHKATNCGPCRVAGVTVEEE